MGLPAAVASTPGSRGKRGEAVELSELAVLDWIPDGIIVADRPGRMVFVNRAAEVLTGYRREELLGQLIEMLVPENLRADHRRHRRAYFAGRTGPRPMDRPERDFHLLRKDGRETSTDIALSSIGPRDGRYSVSAIRDVTGLKRLQEELGRQALHDPLTGLANRTLFFDRLNRAILDARRHRKKVALVMLDLDGFKAVNDAYGHAVGDEVLKTLSARMTSGGRATDTIARIGGDEFAWILPHVAGRAAVQRTVAYRLRSLREPFEIDHVGIEVSAAAGVAMYPLDGHDADVLMRHADGAMYSAKREGRTLAFYAAHR